MERSLPELRKISPNNYLLVTPRFFRQLLPNSSQILLLCFFSESSCEIQWVFCPHTNSILRASEGQTFVGSRDLLRNYLWADHRQDVGSTCLSSLVGLRLSVEGSVVFAHHKASSQLHICLVHSLQLA
jgi:hypothetical protein